MRLQFLSAVEQRLQVRVQGFGDCQQRPHARISLAKLDFLKGTHGEASAVCDLLLGGASTQRRASFTNGRAQCAQEPIARRHARIVPETRSLDHVQNFANFTSYGQRANE